MEGPSLAERFAVQQSLWSRVAMLRETEFSLRTDRTAAAGSVETLEEKLEQQMVQLASLHQYGTAREVHQLRVGIRKTEEQLKALRGMMEMSANMEALCRRLAH